LRHMKTKRCINRQKPCLRICTCQFCGAKVQSRSLKSHHRSRSCTSEQIRKLKAENEKLSAQLKRNQGNVVINNIYINGMAPTNLSKLLTIDAVRDAYSKNAFKHGGKGAASVVLSILNEEEEIRYACTDPARLKFKYKNERGEIVSDSQALKLWNASKTPIKTVTEEISKAWIEQMPTMASRIMKHTFPIREAQEIPPRGFVSGLKSAIIDWSRWLRERSSGDLAPEVTGAKK